MLLHHSSSSLMPCPRVGIGAAEYDSYNLRDLQSSSVPLANSTVPGSVLDFHTDRTLSAANHLANMAMLQLPVMAQSPLFSSCLELAAMSHLSAWPLFESLKSSASIPAARPSQFLSTRLELSAAPSLDQERLRGHVRVEIGALKAISQLWPVARLAAAKISCICLTVFSMVQHTHSSSEVHQIRDAGNSVQLPGSMTEQEFLISFGFDEQQPNSESFPNSDESTA